MSFDWRNYNKVTPVKDQGQCNSGWAFADVEAIESGYALKNNLDATNSYYVPPLSPQNLIDCDTTYNDGCNGGNASLAITYVHNHSGISTDSAYSYVGTKHTTCSAATPFAAGVYSSSSVTNNETDMLQALVWDGPLVVSVDSSVWQDYTGGVLMAWDCGSSPDHFVNIIGYDMTQSTPFWIVRNSLGTDWGENGYIRLEHGHDTCGLTSEVVVPTFS